MEELTRRTLRFEKIDNHWKMSGLEWEGQPVGGNPNAVKIQPTADELEQFWNDNIQAIIASDEEKIAEQTNYPLYNNLGGSCCISKNEFVQSMGYYLPLSIREKLKDLSVDDLKVGFFEPIFERKVDGIYVDEPIVTPLYISTGPYEGLTFKNIDGHWLLARN
jgi:hypothetical protein